MFILIDNYDSFTYNLVHLLGELGADMTVFRNDVRDVPDLLSLRPRAIVLSPGPGDPTKAGVCMELCRAAAAAHIPVLGVCLGHQAIIQAFGGRIGRCRPMHGKLSPIHHSASGLFRGLPDPFMATRYHSLAADEVALPACFTASAHADDGTLMAVAHREKPLYGVQFHPESIASEGGRAILDNFLGTVQNRIH